MPASFKCLATTLIALVLALATGTGAVAQDNTTLRFAWWGGASRHEATLKAIKAFEQQNPGVKIKAEIPN